MEDAINPFTGDHDTQSVIDYIEDEMETDISSELDQQLKMLHEDLDIVALYRSYLGDKKHLNDMERLGLNLAIESLTTKVNIINNDVISGLNAIAENKFNTIHQILEDTKKYISYTIYKFNDCKSIPECIILCGIDAKQKMHHDLDLLIGLHQELKEFHAICTDNMQDTLITPKMYNFFTYLSKLGLAINSKNNVVHLSYDIVDTKQQTFHTLGYQSISDLSEIQIKLNECIKHLNYNHVTESVNSMESEFIIGIESFNTKITNTEMMIGDTTYIENFTKMLIYKKRLIIMAKILKAALALTHDKVKQFATMVYTIDTGGKSASH